MQHINISLGISSQYKTKAYNKKEYSHRDKFCKSYLFVSKQKTKKPVSDLYRFLTGNLL